MRSQKFSRPNHLEPKDRKTMIHRINQNRDSKCRRNAGSRGIVGMTLNSAIYASIGLLCCTSAMAQFTVLHSFTSAEGTDPSVYSALATDGIALYGTARQRGPGLAEGTVFRLNLSDLSFTVLHVFTNSPDGSTPSCGLVVQGSTIYGSTEAGGPSPGLGLLFTMNTNGENFSVLHSFHGSLDGRTPRGDLLLADGRLYGTTCFGGIWGQGVIFSVNTNGSDFTVLHHFTSYNPNFGRYDGGIPFAGLTLVGETLYGTTTEGGTNNINVYQGGTVYKLHTNGTGYTILHSFTNYPAPDGIRPFGRLVVNGDTLYGTTEAGSTNESSTHYGSIFSLNTNGENFKVIHTFDPFMHGDGGNPFAGLTLAGNRLYGTATQGGIVGVPRYGVLFSFKTDGSDYTITHPFTNGFTGANPASELLLYEGALYGTTGGGGAGAMSSNNPTGSYGTIFKLPLTAQFFLRTSNFDGGIFISWQNDGLNHILQTTTNLATDSWADLAPNWTNLSQIGLLITNTAVLPQAFFRLH